MTKNRNLTRKEVAERNEKIYSDFKLLTEVGSGKMEAYQKLADKYGIVERNTVSQIVYKKQNEEKLKELA